MAYVDPNQQQPAAMTPPATAPQQAPTSTGGAGVAGATKAPATPGQNVPAQPSAQLSAYLAANQPQATALGAQVAQNVGQQVQAAGQAIAPAAQAYAAGLPSVPTDAAVNAAVATSPSSLTPAQQKAYQAELGAATQTPNSANTFETTAPYQSLTQGVQQAVDQANLWNAGNNVASMSTALTPYEGSQATTGDKTLDALLLSQTPGAYGQIQSAVAPAASLPGQLNAATGQADAALQAAIAADQAATPAAQSAAQTYATNLTQALNQALAQQQAALQGQEGQNSALESDFASGALTAADAQLLGIPATQAAAFASSYNSLNPAISTLNTIANNPSSARATGPTGLSAVNLGQYLSQTAAPGLSLENVATPQNYSDVAALLALTGVSSPTLPISSATSAQAGQGLNLNALDTFNTTGAASTLSQTLATAQKFYNGLVKSAQADPPQTSAQAQVLNQALTNANNIVQYLNAMVGQNGYSQAPFLVGLNPTPPAPAPAPAPSGGGPTGGYRLTV